MYKYVLPKFEQSMCVQVMCKRVCIIPKHVHRGLRLNTPYQGLLMSMNSKSAINV